MRALPERLAAALALAPPGESLVDVGCDHGLLAIAAAQEGRRVVAVDIHPEPLERAARNVAEAGVSVALRLGDGLGPLADGEVDGAVIAGIGGVRAWRLLSQRQVRWAVLQVNRDRPTLRRRLLEAGWRLEREVLAAERGRLFPTLLARPGAQPRQPSAEEAILGRLPQDADPARLERWLQRETRRITRELARLRAGGQDERAEERAAWLRAIARVSRRRRR